jgi:plastocyanin
VLALAANPQGELKYSTASLAAKAGKVTIAFTNQAPLSHNLTVESASGSVVGATPTFQGATKALTLELKPGTYKFFCTVPGHRQAGMEGTLVVK